MQQSSFIKNIVPILLLFILVNSIFFVFQENFLSHKINAMVVLFSNSLLFIVSIMGLALQTKAMNNKNANAAIRGVMGATILKLFILAIAAVLYIFLAKENRSIGAIIVSMGLYIIYTVVEIKIALKINKQQSAAN